MKNFDPSRWDIYPTLPENWAITQGATMAPRGYVIIDNQKSRFGGERKHGLMPIKDPVLDNEDIQDLNLVCVGEAVNVLDGWMLRIK